MGYVMSLHIRRAECFILLKNKTMAKKNIREAKKLRSIAHPGFEQTIQNHEDLIDAMVDDKRKEQKFAFDTKAKCSNPLCVNVEEREKQFQVCAKCRAARYCNRKCQKTHWKLGH